MVHPCIGGQMVWLLSALAAGPEPVEIVIGGETLAIYHGEYCSFPRLPGVTTKPKNVEPPQIDWDHTFDFTTTKTPFTGLRMGDPAHSAVPLQVVGEVGLPEFPLVRAAVAACAPQMIDRPGMEELMRKSNPAQRSLLIRHVLNQRLKERTCARVERPKLMQLAVECQEGKCAPFLERLEVAGVRCK